MKKHAIFLFFITMNLSLLSQTIVDSLNVYGIWTKAASPYLIKSNIAVASYDTLIIEAGVEVIFKDYFLFQIFGHFSAIGEINDSIYFTVADTSGFSTNSHKGWGGLDFLYSPGSAELKFCVINYSKASGIYLNGYGDVLISQCWVHSNSKGISTWSYPGELNISQSIVLNNRNSGITCWVSNYIYLNDIVISDNGLYGLALSGFSNIQLTDFEISNNGGRGIYSGGDFSNQSIINNGKINSNTGGGVFIDWLDNISMNNVNIEDNGPASIGGGIYTKSFGSFGSLTIKNNTAINGGGIALSELTSISNSIIENNSAVQDGGGIYCSGSILSLDVSNVKILGNYANTGGGLYLSAQDMYDPSFQFSNIEISKNHAFLNGGGVYCIVENFNEYSSFNKLTVSDNTSDMAGGGVMIESSNNDSINLNNSILWNNIPEEIFDTANNIIVTYSDIEGGWPGLGNINANPFFTDPTNGDYRLNWLNFPLEDYTKSPCIDSGSDGTDMGAYPFDWAFYEQFLPVINSIVDVPNDQGKKVVINWTRSILDNPTDGIIDNYTIWRKQNWAKESWEYMGASPAQNFEEYAFIANAISDSCETGIPYFTYMVSAVDEELNKYYYSYPDSGYSVDNIAPFVPIDFAGNYYQDTVKLLWQECPDEDFSHYSLYRSDDPDNFPTVPYLTTIDELYFDIDLVIDTLYYRLTATDINDNESSSSDTLMIIVPKEVILDVKVYLEGSYLVTGMIPYLNLSGLLPTGQPYNTYPWYFEGTESVSSITNLNIVDWMLVELRDAPTVEEAVSSTGIGKCAVFVLNDGNLVASDQYSLPRIEAEIQNNLFIVLYHRNHLNILSSSPVLQNDGVYSYNFASGPDKVYGGTYVFKLLGNDNWGMISGEASGDGQINNTDKNNFWYPEYLSNGYLISDFNMNGFVNEEDRDDFLEPNLGKGIQEP